MFSLISVGDHSQVAVLFRLVITITWLKWSFDLEKKYTVQRYQHEKLKMHHIPLILLRYCHNFWFVNEVLVLSKIESVIVIKCRKKAMKRLTSIGVDDADDTYRTNDLPSWQHVFRRIEISQHYEHTWIWQQSEHGSNHM